MQQLTFLSQELHVNHSLSPDDEQDWATLVASWSSSFYELWDTFARAGSPGKTSPVSCQAGTDGTLVPSSGRWKNSGTGGPTERWTLSSTECPSAVVASSLWDILETIDVPQRFYLTAKACLGILRRAKKRGRTLPPHLQAALQNTVDAARATTAA